MARVLSIILPIECNMIPVNAINVPKTVKSAARVVGARLWLPPPKYWAKNNIPDNKPIIIIISPGKCEVI